MSIHTEARSMDTSNAAIRLDVPRTTLVYWRTQRVGPRWYKLGRHVRYDLADLDAFVDQQKRLAAAS